jgi:2-polyprenyl-6-methoxyphenol hydroxylase-like FAD-dependent oxidoreductase
MATTRPGAGQAAGLRLAIVGAGLAGLATAAALSRSGHEVTVLEQADGLRASGELPARGLPHVNVERAELLSSLAATLPPDAVTYGVRCRVSPHRQP